MIWMLCSYNFYLYSTLLLFDLFYPIKGNNFKEEKNSKTHITNQQNKTTTKKKG